MLFRSIADLQFERYEAAFEILAKREEHYKAMPAMVANARSLLPAATNGRIAAKQIAYASSLYDKVKVEVNGNAYSFGVAPTISCGREFIETRLVRGANLNALPAGQHAAEVATAIETVEVMHTLQGKATDKDRHGAQQGIEQQFIGIFDVGQIPFNAQRGTVALPTPAQKFALGQTVARVFMTARDRKGALTAFAEAVAQQTDPAIKNYLVAEQRALLARADVHAHIGASDAERMQGMKDVFFAALHAGPADKHLLAGVAQAAGLPVTMLQAFLPAPSGKIRVVCGG